MTNRDEIESALIELRAIIEQHLNMLTLYGPQKPIVREYAREAIRQDRRREASRLAHSRNLDRVHPQGKEMR
jgi:hypothetical protein